MRPWPSCMHCPSRAPPHSLAAAWLTYELLRLLVPVAAYGCGGRGRHLEAPAQGCNAGRNRGHKVVSMVIKHPTSQWGWPPGHRAGQETGGHREKRGNRPAPAPDDPARMLPLPTDRLAARSGTPDRRV